MKNKTSSLWFVLSLFLVSQEGLQAANQIQIENALQGTSGWRLTNPALNSEIEGYASLTSVNAGGQISLFVNTIDFTYQIEIYRMGWYGGLGGRQVMSAIQLSGIHQVTPVPDQFARLECNWVNPYVLSVPAAWVSGFYLAKLTGISGKQSYIIFVVRNDANPSALLFQSAVNTWQNYNDWGGISHYVFNSQPPYSGYSATKTSFNRPYAKPFNPSATLGVGAGEFLNNFQAETAPSGWEYNMVRFLEREDYDVTYCTDVDISENASLPLQHRVLLIVGHSEYWSTEMRANVINARDKGVHLAIFGADTCFVRIFYETSPITGATDRTVSTDMRWRDLNLPESALVGVMFVKDPVNIPLTVVNTSHWVFAGTGLKDGDQLPGLVGYEVDEIFGPGSGPWAGSSPSNIIMLGNSGSFPDFYHMSIYTAPSSAMVFATGSMQFNWGLDDDYNVPAVRPSVLSPAAQQIARNVLNRFSLGQGVSVTVGPPTATLFALQTQQFTATVNGTTNQQVSWSIVPAGVGSISAGGLYTAPSSVSTQQTITVQATSLADPTKSGSATVTLNPPVTVSVSPPTTTLSPSQSQQFTATITGTTNQQVNWSIVPAGVGSISAGGSYTAPASVSTLQTVTVRATSAAFPAQSGSATVTLNPGQPATRYTFQRSITIARGKVPNTDQTNFPVMIAGTYPYLATVANGGHIQNPNGYDIIFTADSAGSALLNWEIESYNPSTGAVAFWVQVPTVSHTVDTVLYMFYGNGGIATFQGNRNGTWDTNYAAVYHMADNAASATVTDSTSNGNTGTAQANTSAKTAVGAIGGALSFNGASDYINVGAGAGLAITGNITLEAWIKASSLPSNYDQAYICGKGYNGNNESYYSRINSDGGGGNSVEAGTESFPTQYQAGTSITSSFTGSWHHVVGSYDGSWNIYVDGVKTSSTQTQSAYATAERFLIGARDASGGQSAYFNGAIDEVRISKIARTADWISTEFNNQRNPLAFYTVGSEQSSSVAVTITSPANGSTVSNTITVSASVTSSAAIASVQFKVDGMNLGAALTAAPYSVSLSTTTLTNNSHTISAVAQDTLGNTGSASVTVTVSNTASPPVVAITSPANGSTVSSTITVSASVTAGSAAIASVQFTVDGVNLGGALTTAPYSVSLNTATLSNNSHTISAVAKDTLGNTGSASVTVTVSNTVSPPVVTITGPANGTIVSNTITVSASVTAGSAAIASVQFAVDGVNLGAALTTAPYSVSLNTTTLTNNSHTISAVAKDTLGNTGSASVTVTISNAVGPPGYKYVRSITISHAQTPNTDQTNFPVLVSGVYPYLANVANSGGHVQNSSGYDIIFSSDSAGAQLLNWEMESYNRATGSVAFWVQVPTVSHTTDTVIYISYGNPSISTFQGNRNRTWDSNYVAVYHMADSASNTSVADSTSNGNAGTAQANTSSKTTTGEINAALAFDGGIDYINAGASNGFTITSNVTLEAWIMTNSLPSTYGQAYICGKGYNGNNESYYLRIDSDGNGNNFLGVGTEAFPTQYQATVSITNSFLGKWHHVVGTYDGKWNLYLDGVKTSSVQTQAPYATAERFLIGARDASGGQTSNFNGAIDEVRISKIARPADWVSTEFNNQSNPSSFYSIGSEQTR
jgi:hypothetical protein